MVSRPLALEPQTVVRDVTVLRGKTSVEVHIDASGPVAPVAKVLSDPERIVIDLPDVGYATSRHLPVDAGDVQGVRVALFHVDPPITRVVVDLAHPHEYRLLTARSTVILSIDTSATPAAAAAPVRDSAPASEARLDPPPVPVQPSEVAAAPTVTQPAPVSQAKMEPPGATAEASPQPSSTTPAPPVAEPRVPIEQPDVAMIGIPTGAIQISPADDEETTPHQAAKGKRPGVVRNVTVSHENNAVEVRIEGNKPMRASAATLGNPQRIIIDLADVRWEHPRHIPVKLSEVQAVDVSLYLVNPLVTRVVVSMAHAHPYHLQEDGNSLIVRIETEEINAAGSQPVQ